MASQAKASKQHWQPPIEADQLGAARSPEPGAARRRAALRRTPRGMLLTLRVDLVGFWLEAPAMRQVLMHEAKTHLSAGSCHVPDDFDPMAVAENAALIRNHSG